MNIEASVARRIAIRKRQWTGVLVCFLLMAIVGRLDWLPMLIPSALLIWYGIMRSLPKADVER